MYELLIRIETLYFEASSGWLAGLGAAAVLVGLLFWLAGAVFSPVIIGLLGAAAGAFCGLLVSQWLGPNPLLAMAIGAAALCLAAVLFRNVIIVLLAVLVFALVTGTAYSSVVLSKLPPLQTDRTASLRMQSFSHMDPALRLNYLNQIAQAEAGFIEKFNALLKDTVNTMAPYKWQLIGAVLAGGIVCLLLLWVLRRLVFAACYSLIGALLLFLGTESLLMAADVQLCSAFQNHRSMLSVAYFTLVVLGAAAQLVFTRNRKSEHLSKKELQALAKAAAPTRT